MHYTPFQTTTGNSLSCVCIHSAMRCLSTITGMCAACASAVCNAMRFGRSSGRRRKTSQRKRRRKDGAMRGPGQQLMPIPTGLGLDDFASIDAGDFNVHETKEPRCAARADGGAWMAVYREDELVAVVVIIRMFVAPLPVFRLFFSLLLGEFAMCFVLSLLPGLVGTGFVVVPIM